MPERCVKNMTELNCYKAFGFHIHSAFPIAQLQTAEQGNPDIKILPGSLHGLNDAEDCHYAKHGECNFFVQDVARFRIRNGDTILVDTYPECRESRLGVFLMGSCMGAILHQRGFLPLHGSCVTDGTRSILITGDSGAGKSTLAAEFLSRGWKLLTDDVCAVYNIDGTPMVQSSYPSQKLWQDSLEHYERPSDDIHSLYSHGDREKFGVDATRFFHEGVTPLSMVIRLLPADHPCSVSPIEGMTKVDQLMRNTYRIGMIEEQNRPRHFQRCVTLSTKIPMALVIRENGKQCADTLYDMITDYLGGRKHD